MGKYLLVHLHSGGDFEVSTTIEEIDFVELAERLARQSFDDHVYNSMKSKFSEYARFLEKWVRKYPTFYLCHTFQTYRDYDYYHLCLTTERCKIKLRDARELDFEENVVVPYEKECRTGTDDDRKGKKKKYHSSDGNKLGSKSDGEESE